MSLFSILVGGVFGAAFVALVATVGLHRDRGFYAALLMAIAFFYPVFSAERFALDEAAVQMLIALAFVGVAMVGYAKKSAGILSIGLITHATYDMVGLIFGVHAPELWAEFCIGFDWVLAIAARMFLPRGLNGR